MKKTVSIFLVLTLALLSVFAFSSCGKPPVYAEIVVEDYGTIVLELYPDKAPKSVERFTYLADSGFYDGLTFHRVMNDFMIQGGDPNGDGSGGYSETLYGEFYKNGFRNPITHKRGTISFARLSDPYFDSATSQFFICNSDSQSVKNLDGSYAAFGKVISGMEIVDAITAGTAPFADPISGWIENPAHRAVIKTVRTVESAAN